MSEITIPYNFANKCEKDADDGNVCPKCCSDGIDYIGEEWSATTNTEIIFYQCYDCKTKFAVETVYKPVKAKYLW